MAQAAGNDSIFARIGEYFTLSGAQKEQAKLGEPARKAMDRALSLGRQRADAAESLWSNGHTAEGLRIAVAALRDTLAAAPEYGRAMGVAEAAPVEAKVAVATDEADKPVASDEPAKDEAKDEPAKEAADAEPAKADDAAKEEAAEAKAEEAKVEAAKVEAPRSPEVTEPWALALRARGTSASHIEKVRAALAAADKAELPLLDVEVSAAHADLFQQVLDARHLTDRAFGMVALPPRDLSWTRISRIGTTSLVAVLVLGALYFGMRTPDGVFASASDVWAQSPTFAPETVIDGNEDSYWLLPDGASGWVEARISPPVDVARVRLLNTHNPPHNDRATSAYAVEVYSGGELARTIDGTFEFSTHPEFVVHDVGIDQVDRIRFVVRGHHNVGGGLAEMQWE